MTESNVRNWASIIEPGTLEQAERTARLPILAGPLALMPDAHIGMGATIGSVIPTTGAIIPAAVGVDIGCGMMAQRLDIRDDQLPDSLDNLLSSIEQHVPAGLGRWHQQAGRKASAWMVHNQHRSQGLHVIRHPDRAATQLGTLGGGNHFVEVCLDESDAVWVVLHSGSRGVGNQLAQHHIKLAKELFRADELEDKDLAYFLQDTPGFDRYIEDMLWAQDYAAFNRELMMDAVLHEVRRATHGGAIATDLPINCHHNYAAYEEHNGEMIWVTRKGAIRARWGDLGVIPGSMGQRSYIVRGRGNSMSYYSASHGAGRVMSRTRARKELGDDAFDLLGGVTWQYGQAKELLDEAPAAYKDIDQVMKDQEDLVLIQHELRAVLNYKGTT